MPTIEKVFATNRTNRMCFYCEIESSFLHNPNADYEATKKRILAKLTPTEQEYFKEQPPNDQ